MKFKKEININNLFNNFNIHKIKIVGMIEKFIKSTTDNGLDKDFIQSDTRQKNLVLKCHNKVFVLSENLFHETIYAPDNTSKISIELSIDCKHISKVDIDDLLNETKWDSVFYSIPEEEIILFLKNNEKNIDEYLFGKLKINTDPYFVNNYRTSFIMPFTMCHTYTAKEQIKVCLNPKFKDLSEER